MGSVKNLDAWSGNVGASLLQHRSHFMIMAIVTPLAENVLRKPYHENIPMFRFPF
jgi:hypothetical protein